MPTIQDLIIRSQQIKNEINTGYNSANRVGFYVDLTSLARVNDRTSYIFYRTNTTNDALVYKGVYFTHDTNEMVVESIPRIA